MKYSIYSNDYLSQMQVFALNRGFSEGKQLNCAISNVVDNCQYDPLKYLHNLQLYKIHIGTV